jgi:hypothetical protein
VAKTTTWILLAGAAGLGVYLYTQRSKAEQVAAATGTKPPSSFLDSALGPAKEAARLYAELSTKAAARGSAHHKAWAAAMKRGDKYYHVASYTKYPKNCFVTATLAPAQYHSCQAQELE